MTAPLTHLMASGRLDRFLIAGEWVQPQGTGTCTVMNPATEAELCRIPLGDTGDVDRAVAAARGAFADWSARDPEERGKILARLAELMEERTDLLADCLSLEMGAARSYARATQVPLAIAHVRTACAAAARRVRGDAPMRTNAVHQLGASRGGVRVVRRGCAGRCGRRARRRR